MDDRRAASQFHREEGHVNERPEPRSEFREQGQQATGRQSAQDERQRKIDEVVQRLKQQRERDRAGTANETDKSRAERARARRRRLKGTFRAVAFGALLRGFMLAADLASTRRFQRQSSDPRAIEIARSQSGKSLELRATMSLARLLDKQGHRIEAGTMLADIYNWFTEGFNTADLKDAKALLDELNVSDSG